jgi:hypothetical protein
MEWPRKGTKGHENELEMEDRWNDCFCDSSCLFAAIGFSIALRLCALA